MCHLFAIDGPAPPINMRYWETIYRLNAVVLRSVGQGEASAGVLLKFHVLLRVVIPLLP